MFNSTIQKWCDQTKPLMLAVGKDNKPKEEIALWGQSILDTFLKDSSLVDAYDVYDQLLGYYNDTLQDDLFMISRDGWMPRLIVPTKKSPKWADLSCDLLPVDLAVKVFLNDMKKQFDDKTATLAEIQGKQQAMIDDDENDGYLADDMFFGKRNEKNINKKLKETKAQGVTEEQRNLWQQYLDLLESEKTTKTEIKALDAQLYKEIVRIYGELTEEEARNVIVNKKWLADISLRLSDEMQTAMHRIVTEVNEMHSRYEFTLGELSKLFADKEVLVFNHLKEMGFEL